MSGIRLDEPAEVARRFVGTTSLYMTMIDLDGRVIAVSPPFFDAFLRSHGVSLEGLRGVRTLQADPADTARLRQVLGRLAGGEAMVEVEWELPSAAGDLRTLRSQASYCRDASGAPAAVLLTHNDVTTEVAAEAARRRSEARLRAVVDHLPAEVLLLNLDTGAIELLNARINQFDWGVKVGAAGQAYESFLTPEFRSRLDRAIARAEAGGGAAEYIIDDSERSGRHRRVKVIIFRDENDDRQMLRIAEDVTELHRSTEALQVALAQAEAASQAKTEFLANMSHEIRTPLNGVMGVAGALGRTPLAPEQQEMVSLIETSAKTLEALLSDILDLARIEAGKTELRPEVFEMAELVETCGALFQAAARAKGLALVVSISPEAQGAYLGDAAKLRQILCNLLGNAVKFTDAGEVALAVTAAPGRDGQALTFEVRDTGIGFDAETKARLFARFEQADGTIRPRFGGTGLGLAISRSLAEAMGGVLEAEAQPGVGAVFALALSLPRADGAQQAPTPEAATPSVAADVTGLRILLAEDHAINRRVVELILGSAGVELTCAENGAEAVEAWRGAAFDLILMDMQMPVMDGLTAVREIRRLEQELKRAATPIHVLTANVMPEHIAACRSAGADGHLPKPILAEDLLARVAEVAAARTTRAAEPPARARR